MAKRAGPFVITMRRHKLLQDSTAEAGRNWRPCLRNNSRLVLFMSLQTHANAFDAHHSARSDYDRTCLRGDT